MKPNIIEMSEGMSMLQMAEPRFRSCQLAAVMAVPLAEEDTAAYAVLARLLSRSCRKYPDMTALNRHRELLYGATVRGLSLVLGNQQILLLTTDFLRGRYTLHGEDIAPACTGLLLDMLFEPVLDNGAFREKDFREEQRCQLETVRSQINDKRIYARRQCEKLLCPDGPLHIDSDGTEDTILALTPTAVEQARQKLLSTACIHWIYNGDGDSIVLRETILSRFAQLPLRQPCHPVSDPSFTVKQSEKTDEMDVRQAKLVLGFRLPITEPDNAVMAARLMNMLLGGCPSSLLFRHVREEQSLCYYCSSSYDRLEGTLLVESGINATDADRAKAEILRQVNTIRDGQFNENELEDARRSLLHQFLSTGDTPLSLLMWYTGQTVVENIYSPEEAAASLRAVTKEDVCRAARMLHFDTTYLLRSREEVTAG